MYVNNYQPFYVMYTQVPSRVGFYSQRSRLKCNLYANLAHIKKEAKSLGRLTFSSGPANTFEFPIDDLCYRCC